MIKKLKDISAFMGCMRNIVKGGCKSSIAAVSVAVGELRPFRMARRA